MTFDQRVFKKANTFNLFTQVVENYENKTILDFGGNHGNLIKSSDGNILTENYTCLDVSSEGLEQLPHDVKRIHWNRYHQTYNPNGNLDEPFPKLNRYDLVFANSVFTHMDIPEMLFCINNLLKITNSVYFTYIDPTNKQFFEKVKQFNTIHPILITDQEIDSMKDHDVSYIINHNDLQFDLDRDWSDLWTVVKTDYLKKELRRSIITTGKTDWFNWMHVEKTHEFIPGLIGY